MEELLENWHTKMELYRNAADNATNQINEIKARQKFYTYRDCIKDLKLALILPAVSRSIGKKKQKVDKVLTRDENDETGICTLCKYNGHCDRPTYHKCITELNKGEYYG